MKLSTMTEITMELALECQPEYHELMIYHPALYNEICNGVGSETHWTYHLIPDTIWGLDISPSAGIHDFDWTYPMEFDSYADGEECRLRQNDVFAANVEKQIMAGTWLLRPLRRLRKNTYLKLLNETRAAHNSFWSNKPLPPDWYEHNNYTPTFNDNKYQINIDVWSKIKTRS